VARDLCINEGTLGNWVNADKPRRSEGNDGPSESEWEELMRLPRENAAITQTMNAYTAQPTGPAGTQHWAPGAPGPATAKPTNVPGTAVSMPGR
jgi:hypothetical protein